MRDVLLTWGAILGALWIGATVGYFVRGWVEKLPRDEHGIREHITRTRQLKVMR